MNTDERRVRQTLEQGLLESMIERHAHLQADLRQRLDQVERPEVRELAEQFADRAIEDHRRFCRAALLRTVVSEPALPSPDGRSRDVRPPRLWRRLVLAAWRRHRDLMRERDDNSVDSD